MVKQSREPQGFGPVCQLTVKALCRRHRVAMAWQGGALSSGGMVVPSVKSPSIVLVVWPPVQQSKVV